MKEQITKIYIKEIDYIWNNQETLGIKWYDFKEYYYKDGKLEPRNGQFELYYDSGNLLAKGCYQDGYQIGAWQFFHENGQLWQRGFYIAFGERHGIERRGDTWEWYREDGSEDKYQPELIEE
tara:strand:+ start:576 stop:941 length:366 start_codon:yes stop_codon:yes gene_type:complete